MIRRTCHYCKKSFTYSNDKKGKKDWQKHRNACYEKEKAGNTESFQLSSLERRIKKGEFKGNRSP